MLHKNRLQLVNYAIPKPRIASTALRESCTRSGSSRYLGEELETNFSSWYTRKSVVLINDISLQDIDMLQLFASPAGRALFTGDNRRRGSTSTSSLSRESSSRLKRGRRPSGTVGAPTTPLRQRKSSAELYKEAVEILGLTCSLTDSCRCIDCQVSLSPLSPRLKRLLTRRL